MNQKLSQLTSPVLAGVVREKCIRGAIAEIKNCMYDGAMMIDLHLSCLDNTDIDSLTRIIESSSLPVLALNYNNTYEWGAANFSEDERVESLLRAVEAGAAGIDMQSYTFHSPSKTSFFGEDKYSFTKGNPKEMKLLLQVLGIGKRKADTLFLDFDKDVHLSNFLFQTGSHSSVI